MSLKTLLPRQFSPVLAFAVALTPFIPALVRAAEVAAPAVSLTWTPNPEANLAGYKLHFGSSKIGRAHV